MPHRADARLPSLADALRFVDEFGGGPASDLDDQPGQHADASIAVLRVIAEELKTGLRDLERILAG